MEEVPELTSYKAWFARVRAIARSDAVRKKADELRASGYAWQISFYALFPETRDDRLHHKRIEVFFNRPPTWQDIVSCLQTFVVPPIEDYTVAVFEDSVGGPIPAFQEPLSFE